MSHFTKLSIAAQQKHEVQLIEALEQHFGEGTVAVHESKVSLKDYAGYATKNKANLVITQASQRKKANNNHLMVTELGYERNDEGTYECHYDNDGFNKKHQDLVAKYYAEKVTKKTMAAQGFMVARKELDNGHIQLTCTKYA
jgi:hypothetical protein